MENNPRWACESCGQQVEGSVNDLPDNCPDCGHKGWTAVGEGAVYG